MPTADTTPQTAGVQPAAPAPDSFVPSPDDLLKAQLKSAPVPIRRSAATILALVNWVGLPSTILSILSDMRWVVDAGKWLYDRAGYFADALAVAGNAIAWTTDTWRALTHPIWQALFGWLGFELPSWAADPLTLGALLLAGLAGWAYRFWYLLGLSILSMTEVRLPKGSQPYSCTRIPLRFPYKDLWATHIKWTPRRIAMTEQYWRRWRRLMTRRSIESGNGAYPRYPTHLIHNTFRDAWWGMVRGRSYMRRYVWITLVVAALFAFDRLYRYTFPSF